MDAITEYTTAKCLSPTCVRGYRRSLEDLARSVNGAGLFGVSPEDALAWFASLRVGPTTKARQLSEIRSFYRFAVKRRWVDSDPTDAIEPPRRIQQQVVPYLTVPEMQALIAAPDRRTLRGKRDSALMSLLANTGIRLNEVVSLNIADLHGHQLRILHGKGNKQRLVVLDPQTRRLIASYRKALPAWQRDLEALFPGEIGPRLGHATAQRLITRAGRKAGVDLGKCAPHRFRHGLGTALVGAGVPLSTVQRILGHSSLAVTSRYLHTQTKDLEEAIRLSPIWKRRKAKIVHLRVGLEKGLVGAKRVCCNSGRQAS